MRIKNSQLKAVLQTAQRIESSSQNSPAMQHKAKANTSGLTSFRASRQAASDLPQSSQNAKSQGGGERRRASDLPDLASRAMKYTLGVAGAAYLYDKTANNCFLTTTSLHDGKGGFSSDTRLSKAEEDAEKYYRLQYACTDNKNPHTDSLFKLPRIFGNKKFATMLDYRAATKVHMKNLINTEQAHDSIMLNIRCLKGAEIKMEDVLKCGQLIVPENLDITKSPQYAMKNKYSLSGVRNEETGSAGYASRTITRPFIERGVGDFLEAIEREESLSPKQAVEALEAQLDSDRRLGGNAQLRAGQAFLIFSRAYESNWGTSHKSLMPFLHEKGWLSMAENENMGTTRPFAKEDMKKGLLGRNTSMMGPFFHDIYVHSHRAISWAGLVTPKDFSHREVREMRYIPISHFKLNDTRDGFEDCSGLSDSFTTFNAAVCINHARMMNGEKRLSKDDVVTLVGCFNSVFDNASGVRHSLQETARGCFAGAGYTTEDADDFYRRVCENASEEFYAGKARDCDGAAF
ncbi:hypothetical protein LMG10661_03825 [Ralstonia syzygii subsp. syzygii]|nr:hypothetical protein LMG10661_03825 [Ralstonia syzygii subsp. syzygii]